MKNNKPKPKNKILSNNQKQYIRYCINCGNPKYYCSYDSFRANKHSLLCRSCSGKINMANLYFNKLEKLLLDTPETYYWIGYLLADGHIDNNRIIFSQNNQDKISVEKFVQYIEAQCDIKYVCNEYIDSAIFSIMNVEIVSQLIKKFDIHHNKTYSPPNIDIFKNMDIDLLAFLFIGFVDGDGHIYKLHNRSDFHMTIKLHSSWLNILNIFGERLFGLKNYAKINNSGYAALTISSTILLKNFKKKYLSNIAFQPLKRKWDKINLNYIGKVEMSIIKYQKIKKLYFDNNSVKDIATLLNISISTVYNNIKKIKNEK